jgi:urease accessory protein
MTNDDAAVAGATCLARTLQFGDSTFPIGGFSFSCGLESAIQKGVVSDVATLRAFALTAVEQAARGDGIALIAAHRAASVGDIEALVRIDRLVEARKLTEETRTMTLRVGRKFAEIAAVMTEAPLLTKWRERIEDSATPGCYPVALAVNFAVQGLPALGAFTVHQYSVATTILGAALRLMRVSHIDTQKILFEINGRSTTAYKDAAAAELSDMSGYAPLTEILAAVHVKAHVRLFMN